MNVGRTTVSSTTMEPLSLPSGIIIARYQAVMHDHRGLPIVSAEFFSGFAGHYRVTMMHESILK
jgi:hypothetical protein